MVGLDWVGKSSLVGRCFKDTMLKDLNASIGNTAAKAAKIICWFQGWAKSVQVQLQIASVLGQKSYCNKVANVLKTQVWGQGLRPSQFGPGDLVIHDSCLCIHWIQKVRNSVKHVTVTNNCYGAPSSGLLSFWISSSLFCTSCVSGLKVSEKKTVFMFWGFINTTMW